MAKTTYNKNVVSWELDEKEKASADRAIAKRQNSAASQQLADKTSALGSSLSGSLGNIKYRDHNESVSLQKQLYEYKANLKRLGMLGYDVDDAESGADALQDYKTSETQYLRQFADEAEYNTAQNWTKAYSEDATTEERLAAIDALMYQTQLRISEIEGSSAFTNHTDTLDTFYIENPENAGTGAMEASPVDGTAATYSEYEALIKERDALRGDMENLEAEKYYVGAAALIGRNGNSEAVNAELEKYLYTGDTLDALYIDNPENAGTGAMETAPDFNSSKSRDEATMALSGMGYTEAEIKKMAAYMSAMKNKETAEAVYTTVQDKAGKNAGSATLSSIASVPVNLLFGGLGFLDAAAQKITKGDAPIDYNTPSIVMSQLAPKTREAVSSLIQNNTDLDVFGVNVASFLYNTGMSMADSAAIAYTLGSGGTWVLGSTAASQGVIDAKSRGATDSQALAMGALNGIFETLFEYVSIDKLVKTTSAANLSEAITNALKQGGIEASEEGFTTLANTIADAIVMGDKSELNTSIAYYISEGMSKEDAQKQAWLDWCVNLGTDVIGGFLSGGLMAGGHQVLLEATSGDYKNTYGGAQQELVTEALELDAANTFAQKLQSRLEKGKNLTGGQIAELVSQKESAMTSNDMNNIRQAAASRLTELGETGNIETIAAALAKQASGGTLTISEKRTISNSKYGQRVANELNTDNISSGEYSSDWASGIGTDRVNVESYNRILQEAGLAQESAETQQQETAQPEAKTAQVQTQSVSQPTDIKTEDQPPAAQDITQTAQQTATAETVSSGATISEVAKSYGAQAASMVKNYDSSQDVQKYASAYSAAFDMGESGVSAEYLNESTLTEYLTPAQRTAAYEAGAKRASDRASSRASENEGSANGRTGWKAGSVRGDGVKISDLSERFNDPQRRAYGVLQTIAKATGVNIVLMSSEVKDGKYEGEQGKFVLDEDTIYVDINSGLLNASDVDELAKYTMLRTFCHEFTHFIEKWNPVQYNEFRKAVFNAMRENGENVDELITLKVEQENLSYEMASREVVAESMTDVLPDSNFVQALADNHKSIFRLLLDKLKEFAASVREYFNGLADNGSREARALKETVGDTVKYMDSILKMFDSAAVQAVENYQKANAVDEVAAEHSQPVSSDTAKQEHNAEPIKPAVSEPYTSDNGYTVTDNAQYGSVEVGFKEKPDAAILAVLKERKFRWNGKKHLWYGKTARADIIKALDEAYSSLNAEQIVDNTPTNKEDIKNGGAEAEDGGTPDNAAVSDTDASGSGDTRLLAEVETEALQGDGGQREAVSASRDGGRAAERPDNRTDAERDGGGRSEGSSQSSDIRRDGGLSEQKPPAETLHEEVAQQVEQKSTEKPKGSNFVIGESLNLPSGEKSRFKANIEAIRLVKQLEAEGRNATAAEQEILSRYVGWGGIPNAFGEMKYNRETRKSEMVAKAGWENEFSELRGLLSDEEYRAASASTKNAHYTEISVIKAMYEGLRQLGFTGGRLLEPSSGVGNFVGAMPADMTSTVKSWTMVELDNITGLIAKHLYPNADVRIQGFEKANIPDNFMDVAIGNVPFGDYAITDKAYPKRVKSAIHNYFFAKSLDKVRPGGIVMFITSSYTMNSQDSAVREYISQRADLLGAIRLPNTAFKGNAGTSVVTDILILKKRASGTEYSGEAFISAPFTQLTSDPNVWSGYQGANINEYFTAHPEMVLGTAVMKSGMYSSRELTYDPLEDKGTLSDQIKTAFGNVKGRMDYTSQVSPEKTNLAVERIKSKRTTGKLIVKTDGKVYKEVEGALEEVTANKDTVARITGLIAIRDAHNLLASYLQQGQDAKYVDKARKALNEAYDSFVEKYGYINTPKNKRAISGDAYQYSILSLENYDAKHNTATKADIFTKNTIAPNRTVSSVDDVATGVIVSVNQTGRVDAALIAKLTGKTREAVTRELIDGRLAYKNSDGVLETPETYLSGNVRAKLRSAEALAPLDSDYKNNIEALKAVIPADIAYQDIFCSPGAVWVPDSVYSDFVAHMLGGSNSRYSGPDVVVSRSNETGNFTVDVRNKRLRQQYQNKQQWGTGSRSFLDLFNAIISNRSVVVKYKNADGSYTVDKVATAAAQEKMELISKEFQTWLWSDEARRKELAALYNETFNALVTPKYNGDNLTVNGANALKPLRAHQRDAVQRIISSGGNTLLAHRVGAGKTYEMAAAAMKLKQLGLVKKPMFTVPKSLVAQWGTEFRDFFPTARLLVADDKSFSPANRRVFINQIANGDYDAVIVSYEQFEKIPMSADFQREFYQEQIDEIMAAIAEEKAENGKSLSVKDMEKKRSQLQAKIDKLTDKAKDEDNIDFEQLGVDSLFVDEAHNFKNLEYTSRMTNVAGLGNKDGAKRSFDLYTKVRYMQRLNGGRGVVFATATPVMNSMSELYIMQKYLQPDTLKQLGLTTFDAWAKQFGEVVNTTEIKPSGQGFRMKQVFSRFRNLGELQLLFRSFSDVLTKIDGLKVPKMKGGKVNIVECEPGQFQKDYMSKLEARADNIKNVDPREDNMLKITSDGRKVSYTQRMIDPSLPYEEGCKIYRCCDNIVSTYKSSSKTKGTQLVFLDMSTPKGSSKSSAAETDTDTDTSTDSAQLYTDIKSRLIQKGIPANEIAFIHDAKTDAARQQLFEDVNEGKIRVLIGSTGKMGVGMNAQKRVVAIHHLDAPWRPGDVEQRNGRAYRQGNTNDEVEDFVYVTVGSFDARLWDILDRKQTFINQIMEGDDVGRSAEDTGDVTLSAAEVKALASGNPLIEEWVKLTDEIQKLDNLRRAHNSDVFRAKEKLSEDNSSIATLTTSIANAKEDLKARKDTYSEGKFSMTIGKTVYTDKKEAGIALAAAVTAKAKEGEYVAVGSFAGFEIRAGKFGPEYKGMLFGKQGYGFNIYTGNTTHMVNNMISLVDGFSGQIESWQNRLAELRQDAEAQKKMIAEPFARQTELDQKRARYNEISNILNPRDEQDLSDLDEEGDDTDTAVQYQSRGYLSDKAQQFIQDIDEWDANGRPGGETFILGSTGNIIQGLGAIESDVYMLSNKINTIFVDHPEITVKCIKSLPEILENPILILASRNVHAAKSNSRLVVFGMVKAQNGLPVMIAFELHPEENSVYLDDMQKVVSAYTKDRAEDATASLIRSSEILYADKEKTASLLHTAGFQNAYRIEQSGYIGSIAYKDDGVNISGKDFNKVFIESQYQSRSNLESASPVSQTFTSASTSLPQQLPALFTNKNAKFVSGGTNVDIGAGRTQKSEQYLAERDVTYYPWDPFNRTRESNMRTLDWLLAGNKANTVSCANVLNVIDSAEARSNVILQAAKALKPDGVAYFTTHEGSTNKDKSKIAKDGIARQTGKDSFQNYRATESYVDELKQWFEHAEIKGSLLVATGPKANLPKAAWELTPGEAIQYQQRTSPLTDREVLSIAASDIRVDDLTQAEKDALEIFNERLSKWQEFQERRAELGRQYKEQQFGKNVNREKAAETLDRMRVLDGLIKQTGESVLSVESKEVLKRVLQKSRQVIEQRERAEGREFVRRYRDRRANAADIKKYRDRITRDTSELSDWVSNPKNKTASKHVPDAIQSSVINLLQSIDKSSKRALSGGDYTNADKAFLKDLEAIKSALKENANVAGLYSGYNDLPPGFTDRLDDYVSGVSSLIGDGSKTYVLNRMTASELRELSHMIRNLKKFIIQMNSFHMNAIYQHVSEAAENSIDFMSSLGKASPYAGKVSDFVYWQQIRPAYAFERFGEGGKAVYEELRRGQATLAFNTKKIVDFSEKAYTAEEVRAWSKESKVIELESGESVRMTVAQIMSLYELQKRPQAQQHIMRGGVRVSTYKEGAKLSRDEGHTVSIKDVYTITDVLTDRQMAVADALQKFMAKQGGEWGNYVSVKRFGEQLFGEENYFPINSDGQLLPSKGEESPDGAGLYALLNMSFTKELVKNANNRIVLYNVFDVFANHMSAMAQYNALALPVLDALKWFNYKQYETDELGNVVRRDETGEVVDKGGHKSVTGSLRESMTTAFGNAEEAKPGAGTSGYAVKFVSNILKAFNGTEAQSNPTDSVGTAMLHRYNMAQVAFNIRVVIQQPMAITRAGLLLDPQNIIQGMKLRPTEIKANMTEMEKYSGIAAWKQLGFYDVNVSRGVTELIKHSDTWKTLEGKTNKLAEIGMKGAEIADRVTWAAMWSACKQQVMSKGVKPGDTGFFDQVTALFEDVVYKTQVVDSVLTKNEWLRSRGFFARMTGSFMSEPITTASMLIDAYDKYHMDMRKGMSRQQAWKKNGKMIARVAAVYAVGQILLSIVESIGDAWRDDDEYESFYEKWVEAFWPNLLDELNAFSKLPILKDINEVVKSIAETFGADTYGNLQSTTFGKLSEYIVKVFEIMNDEDSNYTGYARVYKIFQFLSGATGIPLAAATREAISAWNNTVGALAPSLVVRSYEPSETSQIKYAYIDGYLSAAEATDELLKQDIAEDKNEAYWLIRSWDYDGDRFSRYGDLYDAALAGESITEAMSELTSHGYTKSQVTSQLKSQIGTWYRDGEISKQQANSMLRKYCGISSDDATATVNNWSVEVETGIKYNDIDDAYRAGEITAAQATDMYVKYGGYTRAEAENKVGVMQFVKAHPGTDGITSSAIEDYKTYCEPANVSATDFYSVWSYYNGLDGSKQDAMWDYIDSLNLTSDQKDALHLCFYASSSLKHAPWH